MSGGIYGNCSLFADLISVKCHSGHYGICRDNSSYAAQSYTGRLSCGKASTECFGFAGSRKKVLWDELKQIVTMMSIGIAAGILLKGYFAGRENILYPPLGIFVLLLSAQGMARLWKEGREKEIGEDKMPSGGKNSGGFNQMRTRGLLILAGLVHGIFVCGGPLLIGYLTKRVDDKKAFRATISTVWIVLNTIVLMDDIRSGLWETEIVTLLLMTIPFFLAGMFVGERLIRQMSQKTFMVITYVLLIISGISLLFK